MDYFFMGLGIGAIGTFILLVAMANIFHSCEQKRLKTLNEERCRPKELYNEALYALVSGKTPLLQEIGEAMTNKLKKEDGSVVLSDGILNLGEINAPKYVQWEIDQTNEILNPLKIEFFYKPSFKKVHACLRFKVAESAITDSAVLARCFGSDVHIPYMPTASKSNQEDTAMLLRASHPDGNNT
jgi:hypothetical protein